MKLAFAVMKLVINALLPMVDNRDKGSQLQIEDSSLEIM
jgi:hypothetical protein